MGSWLADLLLRGTINTFMCLPILSNKTPLCPSWLLLASLQHSAFPSGNTTFVSVLPGPHSLVPRLLPGRLTTPSRDLLPFLYGPPPHYARLVSRLISRPSGSRTSPAGLGSRPNITDRRLLAADVTERHPASHCAPRQFLRSGPARRAAVRLPEANDDKGLSASHSVNRKCPYSGSLFSCITLCRPR